MCYDIKNRVTACYDFNFSSTLKQVCQAFFGKLPGSPSLISLV